MIRCFCFTLLALGLQGCASSGLGKANALEPQLTDAYTMPSLLAESVEVSSQQDLQVLLAKPWYSAVDVRNAANEEVTSLDNCKNYFSNKTPTLRALHDNEQSAFFELTMACEATRLLEKAEPSKRSMLPDRALDETAPQYLPKPIALVTSRAEREKLMADSSKRVWGDINIITHTERVSDYQMRYASNAGEQTLSEVGRGDINLDGKEDVLILSKDSVAGGSYTNFRLFVLSVKRSGEWTLLEHY